MDTLGTFGTQKITAAGVAASLDIESSGVGEIGRQALHSIDMSMPARRVTAYAPTGARGRGAG